MCYGLSPTKEKEKQKQETKEMSLCDSCPALRDVPECVTNLTIGTITPTNQPINLYFESIATGRYNTVQVTSDVAGLVVADLSAEAWLMADHPYKVYIIDTASADQSLEQITIGSTPNDCWLVNFIPAHSASQTDFTLAE